MNRRTKNLIALGALCALASCASPGARGPRYILIDVPHDAQDCPGVPRSINCATEIDGFVCAYPGDEIEWADRGGHGFRIELRSEACERGGDEKRCKLKEHRFGDAYALVYKYDIVGEKSECRVVDPYIIVMR